MGEEIKVYKILVGKPEEKRPLGRPRHRWEEGIGMDLRDIGWGSVEWSRLAQDRDRWRECGDEPSGSCASVLVSYMSGQKFSYSTGYSLFTRRSRNGYSDSEYFLFLPDFPLILRQYI
jgi:hypothetical protein